MLCQVDGDARWLAHMPVYGRFKGVAIGEKFFQGGHRQAYGRAIARPHLPDKPSARHARYILSHSSNKYSPKSHSAVKKTTSKPAKNPSQSARSTGFASSSARVASVLAISTGVSRGRSSRGNNSSPIRACAEIAENAVPGMATPRLPKNKTSTNCRKTPRICTL